MYQTRGAFFSLKNQDFVLVSVRYGVYRLDPKNDFFLFFSGQNLEFVLVFDRYGRHPKCEKSVFFSDFFGHHFRAISSLYWFLIGMEDIPLSTYVIGF